MPPPTLKIVALPRDSNPYQRLLYDQVERSGHRVRYAGELTPSHTLNLLLLPLELAIYRLGGWRVLHLHWVFTFKLTGSDRLPVLRRIGQAWFGFVLAVARLLDLQIVWTVHNILPHQRVFHDEVAARRRLVRSANVVLAHSHAALDALAAIGARPPRSAVVTQGPLKPELDAATLRPPGAGTAVLRLLFFGQVLEYKGIEDLLLAMSRIPAGVPARLLVAGECSDSRLRDRLRALASGCGDRIELKLQRVPDDEVTPMFAACDAVVLPFRRVTTSSSVLLALGHGRVVVLPRLPAFVSLPPDSVVFYDGSVDDLHRVIVELAHWSCERLQEVGAAASGYVGLLGWADAARQTLAAMGA